MSKPFYLINIFISQIYTTCESHLSVNNHYFPVVTIILCSRKKGNNRRKHLCLDTILLQLLRIFIWKQHNRTHAIIHDSDFHTLFYLFLQNIQHCIPHRTPFNNEILQKNIFLCFFQFLKKICKFIFP